jgi:hypothetical protein
MIISPIYMKLPRKKSADKRISLNMNWYRNAHHHINNEVKSLYKEEMRKQIQQIVKLVWPVKIKYRYFLKVKSDVANVHAVVDKFFCDALVELGRIPDDNIQYVVGASYVFAGYDRKYPRCEIEILENYQP